MPGVAPQTPTYSWSAPTVTGSLTGGAAGSNSSTINGVLFNSGTSYGIATYTVTPSWNGNCVGPTFIVTDTVYPTPSATISYSGQPYCASGTAGVTQTGTTGGTYSISGTDVAINTNTGQLNMSGSTGGTYTVTYTIAAAGGCSQYQTTTTVVIRATPALEPFTSSGLQYYCVPTIFGYNITLSGSQTGVNYQLYLNQSPVSGGLLSGTGGQLNFGNVTATGTYQVVGTNTTTGCFDTVTAQPLFLSTVQKPNTYNLTVNGATNVTTASVCAGTLSDNVNTVSIGLDGSDNGIVYGLILNGSTLVGGTINGNGSPITFPPVSAQGTYTIIANSTSCGQQTMTGFVGVSVIQLPGTPSIGVTTPPSCSSANALISVTNPGSGLTYSLDGGAPGAATSFTVLANTTHTVAAFNGNCYGPADTVTIAPQPVTPVAPTVTVTQPNCSPATSTTGSITVSPTSGYSYSIDGTMPYTNLTGQFTGVAPGTYNVTVYNGSCYSPATVVTINVASVVPSAPTALVLTPGAASISGTFTASTPVAAQGYLVIRTETATQPSIPVTGTTYTPGTNALGGYIVATPTTPSFTDNAAVPGITYYYWIYAYNAQTCVLYSATDLTGSAVALQCAGSTTLYWAGSGTTMSGGNTDITTNMQFNNVLNWSTSAGPFTAATTAPGTCTDVVMNISTTTDQTIPLSAGTAINSLTINLSGSARNIVDAGIYTLTVNGNVSISAGSSPTSKAYLTTEGGRLRIFGNATIGASGEAGYSYIGNGDGTTTGGGLTFRGNATFNQNSAVSNPTLVSATFDANGAETLTNNTNGSDPNVGATAVSFASVKVGSVNNAILTLAGTTGNYDYVKGGNLTVSANSSLIIPGGYALNQLTSATGTFSLGAAATLNIGDGTNSATNGVGGSNFPGGFSTYTLDPASTVAYNSVAGTNQTVYAPITYGNLVLTNATGSGSNIKSLADNIAGIAGNLTANSFTTFDMGTFNANRSANGGSFTLAANSTLRLAGTTGGAGTNNNFPSNFAAVSLDCASTTEYYGATQTVYNGTSYGNLTISTAGTKTAGGNLTICSNLRINTAATFDGVSFSHTVGANWINNGSFTSGTSTVAFISNTAVQTIGGSTPTTFSGLTIANGGGGVTLIDAGNSGISKTVTGLLTLTNGLLTTDAADLLIMTSTATSSLGDPDVSSTYYQGTSFVNGPLQKVVTTTGFTFPVGKAGVGYVPVAVSGLFGGTPDQQTFTAEYFHTSAYTLGSVDGGSNPYINHVSGCDYWRVDLGAAYPLNTNVNLPTGVTTNLTLYWNPNNSAGCSDNYVTDINTLSIAHLTFASPVNYWDAIGADVAYNRAGTYTSGSIQYVGASAFSPFALASSDAQNPLPIKFDYFDAAKVIGYNKLTWKAECSATTTGFVVERSSDGVNFEDIHSVAVNAANACSLPFEYDDYTSTGSKVYYRIKMLDASGNVYYSEIRLILNNTNIIEIMSIKPNPVESEAWLNITSSQSDKVELVIYSVDGREIQRKTVQVPTGSSTINLRTAGLAKGMYVIRGLFGTGQTNTIPFIKQ
jgi:hypothetical protein